MIVSWWLLLLLALCSWLLVGAYRALALRKAWLDTPNHRSSHVLATPHGGGIVILLIVAVFLLFQFQQQLLSIGQLLLLLAPIAIGLIGLLDDFLPLPSALRFALYLLIVCALVWGVMPLPPIDIAGFMIESQWLIAAIFVLALTWLINLFNFMDGINGIAGLEFVFVIAAGLGLFAADQATAQLLIVAIAAVLGFLVWNFPAGKVFLGDAGSTFMGAFIGWLILHSVSQWQASPWVWVILCAVFVADASYTLLIRMASRQSWLSAHRSHSYQIFSRQFNSHVKVTLGAMTVNVLWLLPLAWLVAVDRQPGWLMASIAYVPLLLISWRSKAGMDNG